MPKIKYTIFSVKAYPYKEAILYNLKVRLKHQYQAWYQKKSQTIPIPHVMDENSASNCPQIQNKKGTTFGRKRLCWYKCSTLQSSIPILR